MRLSHPPGQPCRWLLVPVIALFLAACGDAGQSSATGSAPLSAQPRTGGSQAPEASGGTAAGDIPDNTVFLTYHRANPAFSIQYVEGWQVTPQPDGVAH